MTGREQIIELIKNHDLDKEITVRTDCYRVEIKPTDIVEDDRNILIKSL